MYSVRPAKATNGRCPSREYLAELKKNDRDSYDQFVELIQRFQEGGPDDVWPKYKPLKGYGQGLVEFKIWKHRILGWREGNTVFTTHGFKKDEDETPIAEIDRAFRIQSEYNEMLGKEE